MSNDNDDMALVRALDSSQSNYSPPSPQCPMTQIQAEPVPTAPIPTWSPPVSTPIGGAPAPSAAEPTLIGRHVLADNFDQPHWCFGKVIAITVPEPDEPDGDPYYRVLFDDNDEQDYTFAELEDFLLPTDFNPRTKATLAWRTLKPQYGMMGTTLRRLERTNDLSVAP